ncbi:metallopeptidase TldD-related protein [Buchnera aphidicola]|uniref:Metalloprotease PmbA n=1 Tax=Buchnera aphidicola (Cinara curvipes) TaxID=2518975 RepID=A0A451D6B9_9GAMM|nr:metallopeptidase TldD-related protein [Buchnera aphidicola]VFP81356.1 Metalloprotease PmbA [Buchnera aphidicola (Cinara curvipes)]
MLSSYNIQQDLNILISNIQQALLYLKKNVSSGMIIIKKTYSLIISSRYGIIDNIESFNYVSSLVTIYNNFRQSSVFSNKISFLEICKSIDRSISISKYTEMDKCFGLPDINLLFDHKKKINLFFPKLFNLDEIKNLVDLTNSAALNFDSKVINIEGSVFEYSIDINILGNSLGWIDSYLSTCNYLSSHVIARYKNFMERDFSYSVSRDFNDLDDPEKVGQDSAKKSIARLNSKKISTQISPVIFISDIANELFSYLIDAINGYSVYKKSSFLLCYLNKKIFPFWLNIFEDPFINKGLSSRLFDNEGVATKKRKIIENGILKTWLLDTYSSNKLNIENTGHSGGIYNWIVSSTQLTQSFDDILHTMNRGVLITELLGDSINIITGNYSFGICGFWIEDGIIKYPIHGITISGNLINTWNNIILIANDINKKNNIQCSSVLIDKIQISGY